jgi:hypothetical protein
MQMTLTNFFGDWFHEQEGWIYHQYLDGNPKTNFPSLPPSFPSLVLPSFSLYFFCVLI